MRIRKEAYDGYKTAWTVTPVNYNIRASDPAAQKRPSRAIAVGTAGTLVVTDKGGNTVTLPTMTTPFVWEIEAVSLGSTSTGLNVVVFW